MMLKATFAPLEAYPIPITLQLACHHHGVASRIQSGTVGVNNRLGRAAYVEAIGPEVLTVGVLQVHVHVASCRPREQVHETALGTR